VQNALPTPSTGAISDMHYLARPIAVATFCWAVIGTGHLLVVHRNLRAGDDVESILAGDVGNGDRSARLSIATPDFWRFESPWMRGAHCGPNCLYVCLRLLGVEVELLDVADQFEIRDNTKGCSIDQLATVAKQFGLSGEVRFVSTSHLSTLPMPYILHCTQSERSPFSGHFLTVVGHNPQTAQFAIVDGTTGDGSLMAERDLFRSVSGYVFVPASATIGGVTKTSLYLQRAAFFLSALSLCLGLAYVGRRIALSSAASVPG